VLSLHEVHQHVVAKSKRPEDCEKLVSELAWRDYFQRCWFHLGDQIWSDVESWKTGHDASWYADELPEDIRAGKTGVDYIDAFVRELTETGYLHNHARMWLAAYVVHARRVKWQAGARWFLELLLDGDEASNNLSWQWIASTFSSKPYVFNRDNVLRNSGAGRFQKRQGPKDPFDGTYEQVSARLFRAVHDAPPARKRIDMRVRCAPLASDALPADLSAAFVWVHDGMMSPAHAAVLTGAPAVFFWDDVHIAEARHSAARIAFQRSALFCPDQHTGSRSLGEALVEHAAQQQKSVMITSHTPDPRLQRAIEHVRRHLKVCLIADTPFVALSGAVDLSRFSRFWEVARAELFHKR
jgi:deoxyribodipyrimidine photo-lyase